jgi:hypothetical protein
VRSLLPHPAWANSSMTVAASAAVQEPAVRRMLLLRSLPFILGALGREAVDVCAPAEELAGR